MRTLRVLTWVAAGSFLATAAPAADDAKPDVRHYDLAVTVDDDRLTERVWIHAKCAQVPGRWTLDLAPEMKVVAAECEGKAVTCAAKDGGIEVDLAPLSLAAGTEFALALRVEGAPRENGRAGRNPVVRSAVKAGLTYIRSQHPWYPRAADDAATYRTIVNVPDGWSARTAGRTKDPEPRSGRLVWTFERDVPGRPVGLVAGKYHPVGALTNSVDALVLSADHAAGATAAMTVATKASADYTQRFGKLADARLTLVEMPEEFGPGSGYGEDGYLLIGTGAFGADGGDWVAPFIAHETAHAWWGHAVAFSDFGNEALANWSALAFQESDAGADAARALRRTAVDRVAALAAAGKDVALSQVRGFGGGMDREVYDTLAYQKSMMLLVMSREVLGDVAFAKVLAKLFETRRGTTAAWADVRAAVSAASADAKALFDRWDAPGVPALAVASQSKKSGSKWTVTGKVSQPGTAEPRPMRVRVVATCGKKAFEATVNLTAGEAPFTIAVPSEPESVVADPEFLVLATRASASGIDAEKVLAEAFAVVNSPADDDPAHCAKAMSQLRSLLDSGDDRYAGQCHVGIGRLLFRTGKLDEAKSELETALKMGGFGPFHRSWTLFRLGCISDVQKRRDDAVARYKAVIELKGANEFVVKRAKQFVEKAYRGYGEDG